MVPVRSGAILDLEVVLPRGAAGDGEARMAVVLLGDVQPVPMDDGRLVQRVLELHAHPLARSHAEGGTEIARVGRLEARRRTCQAFALEPPNVSAPARPIDGCARACALQ